MPQLCILNLVSQCNTVLIGYARVSRSEQNIELQIDALKNAGVADKDIHQEHLSGVKSDRPALRKAFSYLREGDTFVVWKLDRLGRSLKDLITILEELDKRKIQFKSLTEGIDTNTSIGRMMFQIFGVIAEFERATIIERTMAGLEAAKLRGKKAGRRITHNDRTLEQAREAVEIEGKSIAQVCEEYGISRGTYYRRLKGK